MHTTVANKQDATDLAQKIIESHLGVCVNIMAEHTAVYKEADAIKTVSEIGMLIKIPESLYEFAYEAIKSWHPYQIPALISWPAEVNHAYSLWAHQNIINQHS
jgi:periplasmic divalent cation tolerance protein